MVPRLSVCIPTHHGRAASLDRLIGELAAQVDGRDEVEVCVSDNASHDETEAVIARHRDAFGRLAYRRNAHDLGVGPNILRVVELAEGEYCWLFGSDDRPAPGAIDRLLALLDAHPGVAGIGLPLDRRSGLELETPAGQLPPESLPEQRQLTMLANADAVIGACGILPCFLSSNVVRRDLWRSVAAGEAEAALRYPTFPQVWLLGRMMLEEPRWLWCPAQLVRSRADQIFVTEDGSRPLRHWGPWSIELDRLWAALHGRMSRRHRWLMFRWYRMTGRAPLVLSLKTRLRARPTEELALLASYVRAFWWLREFRRQSLPVLLVPGALLRSSRGSLRRGRAGAVPGRDGVRIRVEVTLPDRLWAGFQIRASCLVHNRGERPLSSLPPERLRLAACFLQGQTRAFVSGSESAPVIPRIRPGHERELGLWIDGPREPGDYLLHVSLVDGSDGWASEREPASGWERKVRVEAVGAGAAGATSDPPPVT